MATFLVALFFYAGAYLWLRETSQEVSAQDGAVYVVFPEDRPWLYKLYRPAAYLDAVLTGMRFHFGPHEGGGV
ncbi:MAG: hypothetical protein AAFY59_07325 [Pseudomonadota bacterium]